MVEGTRAEFDKLAVCTNFNSSHGCDDLSCKACMLLFGIAEGLKVECNGSNFNCAMHPEGNCEGVS